MEGSQEEMGKEGIPGIGDSLCKNMEIRIQGETANRPAGLELRVYGPPVAQL